MKKTTVKKAAPKKTAPAQKKLFSSEAVRASVKKSVKQLAATEKKGAKTKPIEAAKRVKILIELDARDADVLRTIAARKKMTRKTLGEVPMLRKYYIESLLKNVVAEYRRSFEKNYKPQQVEMF